MNAAIVAAAIGSVAPTGASLLAYATARSARRETERADLAGLASTVETLSQTVQRTEQATGRIETAVGGLRERVARVEGRLDPGAPVRPALR